MTYSPWTWNPKNLGVQKSLNARHENDVWLYLRGKTLKIIVQTNLDGKVVGTTSHSVRLPRTAPEKGRSTPKRTLRRRHNALKASEK